MALLKAYQRQAKTLEKVEAYARSLMGDANDSCMSEDIGQGLLDLLAQK